MIEVGQTKVLSKNEVLRVTGVSGKQYKTIQWHTVQIVVRPLLNMEEYIKTVRAIVVDCMSKDGEIAIELLDFSTRLHIIAAYAFVELPDDMEQLYYVVYQSDLYDTVLKVANRAQIDAIIKTVTCEAGWCKNE